jgi:penicillin-binding protein 2
MQLAYTVGGIINGGSFRQPHLLMNSQSAPEVKFPISESTVETISNAMWGVVNEPGGTAAASRLQGIEFSGKTGTAQTISYQGRDRIGHRPEYQDNAWFVGFAPRRNPEIVVAVLVQSGGHGSSAAAPIARDVVKMYYDKKTGKPSELMLTKGPSQTEPPQAVLVRAAQPAEAAPAEEQLPMAVGR